MRTSSEPPEAERGNARNPAAELHAALLQAAITFGLAAICAFLYGRYKKPYFQWFALAWALYLLLAALGVGCAPLAALPGSARRVRA